MARKPTSRSSSIVDAIRALPRGTTLEQALREPILTPPSNVPERRAVARTAKRTLGERFAQNREDALQRGIAMAAQRAVGGDLAAQTERNRREAQDLLAAADPFTQAGSPLEVALAGGATAAGQLVGAMQDPTSYLAPGRTILGRALGAGAVGAATDVGAQALDIGSDVQDRYSPAQSALSAIAPMALSLGGDALARGLARPTPPPTLQPVNPMSRPSVFDYTEPPMPERAPRPAPQTYDEALTQVRALEAELDDMTRSGMQLGQTRQLRTRGGPGESWRKDAFPARLTAGRGAIEADLAAARADLERLRPAPAERQNPPGTSEAARAYLERLGLENLYELGSTRGAPDLTPPPPMEPVRAETPPPMEPPMPTARRPFLTPDQPDPNAPRSVVGSMMDALSDLYRPGSFVSAMGAGPGQASAPPIRPPELDPLGFRSSALEAAKRLPDRPMPPSEAVALIQKGAGLEGFKGDIKAEIDLLGLRDAFEGRRTVTRQEVEDYIRSNRFELRERQMGRVGSRYDIDEDPNITRGESSFLLPPGSAGAEKVGLHTKQKGELMHSLWAKRPDDKGGSSLFVRQLQSDLAQGLRLGRIDLPGGTPPLTQDTKQWTNAGVRALTIKAAKENADSISFPTGKTSTEIQNNDQASRYYDTFVPEALERVAKVLGGRVRVGDIISEPKKTVVDEAVKDQLFGQMFPSEKQARLDALERQRADHRLMMQTLRKQQDELRRQMIVAQEQLKTATFDERLAPPRPTTITDEQRQALVRAREAFDAAKAPLLEEKRARITAIREAAGENWRSDPIVRQQTNAIETAFQRAIQSAENDFNMAQRRNSFDVTITAWERQRAAAIEQWRAREEAKVQEAIDAVNQGQKALLGADAAGPSEVNISLLRRERDQAEATAKAMAARNEPDGTVGYPAYILDLTPEMRARIKREGLPMLGIAAPAAGLGLAAAQGERERVD